MSKPSPSAIRASGPLSILHLSADRLAVCNVCGNPSGALVAYRAHDERDKPIEGTRALVFLGEDHPECLAKLQKHPRLFDTDMGAPGYWPALCAACTWRSGVACTNPLAKANGGAGVRVEISSMGVVCFGRGRGGCRRMQNVVSCAGRVVRGEAAP